MSLFAFDFSDYLDKDKNPHWEKIRQAFSLNPKTSFFDTLLLTSHPRWIKESIRYYGDHLDRDPGGYWENHFVPLLDAVSDAASRYLLCDKSEIGFTSSATVTMGVLFGGLDLEADSEIIFTDQAHYSQYEAIRYSCAKKGYKAKKIALYKDSQHATADEILENLKAQISGKTRVIALTWLQSGTGVKLPAKKISKWVESENKKRSKKERIFIVLDGVHGFGIEKDSVKDLGVDAFMTSCHKWLFGPRGTGLFYMSKEFARHIRPIIAPYVPKILVDWKNGSHTPLEREAYQLSPGGFLAFEYLWSLKSAFDFHLTIGREKIAKRSKHFASEIKKALLDMPHIRSYTPLDEELSSGVVCFDIEGFAPGQVVEILRYHGFAATQTPYAKVTSRLTPSILNTQNEVLQVIEAIRNFSSLAESYDRNGGRAEKFFRKEGFYLSGS